MPMWGQPPSAVRRAKRDVHELEGVIPRPRVLTSGARDLACTLTAKTKPATC